MGTSKLIELLNEYEDLTEAEECDQWYIDDDGRINEGGWWSQGIESWICSKKYGFIKRLVDNDKIDKVKQVIKDIDIWGSDTITGVDTYSDYESLLMLLAISNSPIDDLISYLK